MFNNSSICAMPMEILMRAYFARDGFNLRWGICGGIQCRFTCRVNACLDKSMQEGSPNPVRPIRGPEASKMDYHHYRPFSHRVVVVQYTSSFLSCVLCSFYSVIRDTSRSFSTFGGDYIFELKKARQKETAKQFLPFGPGIDRPRRRSCHAASPHLTLKLF